MYEFIFSISLRKLYSSTARARRSAAGSKRHGSQKVELIVGRIWVVVLVAPLERRSRFGRYRVRRSSFPRKDRKFFDVVVAFELVGIAVVLR